MKPEPTPTRPEELKSYFLAKITLKSGAVKEMRVHSLGVKTNPQGDVVTMEWELVKGEPQVLYINLFEVAMVTSEPYTV
jgi:hypothetical protein